MWKQVAHCRKPLNGPLNSQNASFLLKIKSHSVKPFQTKSVFQRFSLKKIQRISSTFRSIKMDYNPHTRKATHHGEKSALTAAKWKVISTNTSNIFGRIWRGKVTMTNVLLQLSANWTSRQKSQ